LVFLLIFLLIPVYLDKYEPSFSGFNELVLVKTENKIIPPEVIKKPVTVKKAVKPLLQPPVEELALVPLPVELDSIALSVAPISLDTVALLAEMEQLKVSPSVNYRSRRFYIPPVKYELNPKELILPLSLIAVGTLASNTEKFRDILPIERSNPTDQLTPFDNFFQLVPPPSLFVFDAIGKEKHHPIDQFFLMAFSYGFTTLPVRVIKAHYNSPRPYGGNHSFPSGHTATAFVGAHMIYKEFKDSNTWIAYSGYALGMVTAGARVAHDKHWICDVMAGAGIAMLSTELAYLVYFPIRNFITDEANKIFGKYIIISPMVYSGTTGLSLSVQF
jgi:hypothetical protein